jgi:hypothetical protein
MLREPAILTGEFCNSAPLAEELWQERPEYRLNGMRGGDDAQDRRGVFR